MFDMCLVQHRHDTDTCDYNELCYFLNKQKKIGVDMFVSMSCPVCMIRRLFGDFNTLTMINEIYYDFAF